MLDQLSLSAINASFQAKISTEEANFDALLNGKTIERNMHVEVLVGLSQSIEARIREFLLLNKIDPSNIPQEIIIPIITMFVAQAQIVIIAGTQKDGVEQKKIRALFYQRILEWQSEIFTEISNFAKNTSS